MYKLAVVLLAVFAVVLPEAFALQCNGKPNNNPVWTGQPTLVNAVPNGKLYTLASPAKPNIAVVHVWGTPYQMGYAYGQLLGPQVKEILSEVMTYIEDQVMQYLSQLPAFLQRVVAEWGVDAALDLTWTLTKPYIPDHFNQEMQGIADAAKVDFATLMRINLFPELIQAACSMFGAWGPAIKNTNGTLYQLRALDWSTNGPFQKFPVVAVYHPSDPNTFDFATVGWAGFVGAITGFSSSPLGVCEKVYIAYNGTQDRSGYPWHFLLRDILEFDVDIASATNRMVNAARTCSVWLGVGDGHQNQFRLFEYSHDYVRTFDDKNFPTYPNHPLMPGLVWVDKHVQPSGDPCMTELLQQYYGNITPQNTLQYITSQFQTGDMHIAIYDYANKAIFVSNASPVDAQGNVVNAYDRPFVRIDMGAAFSEQPPTM